MIVSSAEMFTFLILEVLGCYVVAALLLTRRARAAFPLLVILALGIAVEFVRILW